VAFSCAFSSGFSSGFAICVVVPTPGVGGTGGGGGGAGDRGWNSSIGAKSPAWYRRMDRLLQEGLDEPEETERGEAPEPEIVPAPPLEPVRLGPYVEPVVVIGVVARAEPIESVSRLGRVLAQGGAAADASVESWAELGAFRVHTVTNPSEEDLIALHLLHVHSVLG
jgi:hypothetical protein